MLVIFGTTNISNMKVTVREMKLVNEYFNEAKPYLKDEVTDLQKSITWNIQSAIAINVISSTYTDKEQVMHLKSDNIEVMTYDNANEVNEEIF